MMNDHIWLALSLRLPQDHIQSRANQQMVTGFSALHFDHMHLFDDSTTLYSATQALEIDVQILVQKIVLYHGH